MRPLSIKTKQVAGVTLMVGFVVVVLNGWYLTSLARLRLEETNARALLVAKTIRHRAFDVVGAGGDPMSAFANHPGMKTVLEASLYSDNVVDAAIVNPQGIIVAHSDDAAKGQLLPEREDLQHLLDAGSIEQARVLYTRDGKSYEVRLPLIIADKEIGSVRVGVSTLLVSAQLTDVLATPLLTAAGAIVLSLLFALLLSQLALRPIHVIRSGLARLGRGELDVHVDLPPDADLGDLGASFRAVSAQLAADRTELAGQRATLESVVDVLEDAVALFGPDGQLLFANPSMQPMLSAEHGSVSELLPAGHPYRRAVEDVLVRHLNPSTRTVEVPGGGERLIRAHPIADASGNPMGVMLVARNLTYLTQVETTLVYSRKLAALSRLTAGIAHEVKNPLNATMIHLELLKMQLADAPQALDHVKVIGAQVRRLDEVVQGFLRFTRPEDLKLQPVELKPLLEDLMPIVSAEASKSRVDVRIEVPSDLPPVNGDSGLLQQAFLNLAINACQAMPHGGRLRIGAAGASNRRIEVRVEDSGVGIAPEHLSRIFDLYYTTKEHGSGIGLSLVYRTVQLHDGEIEVQSVPGRGTTFRVRLPMATH
jgi:nitrogen-specific signal transduction histidine kinase